MFAGNLIDRSKYNDLFSSRLPYLDEILIERFDAPSMRYQLLFDVRDTNRPYESVTGITGLGLFSQKNEADNITYDRMLQGFDKTFEMLTYAKGTQISREAMDDDIDRAISDTVPMLAFSARASIETEAAWEFNNGFTTTNPAPDGAALFGTHTLVGGGTFANFANVDLSQTAIENALINFGTMKNDRSLLVEGQAKTLLVAPQLQWLAAEILKSPLRSDTSNNTYNVMADVNLSLVVWAYLQNTTDWFLLADQSQHRLIWYWREEPVTDHGLDFDSGNMKTKMTMRFDHGPADWRGLYGGNGS